MKSDAALFTPTAARSHRPLAPDGYGYDWRGRLVDLRGLRPGEDGRPAVYESLVKGKEE